MMDYWYWITGSGFRRDAWGGRRRGERREERGRRMTSEED